LKPPTSSSLFWDSRGYPQSARKKKTLCVVGSEMVGSPSEYRGVQDRWNTSMEGTSSSPLVADITNTATFPVGNILECWAF